MFNCSKDYSVNYGDLLTIYDDAVLCRIPFLYPYTVKLLSYCCADSFSSLTVIAESLQRRGRGFSVFPEDGIFNCHGCHIYIREGYEKAFCSIFSKYMCSV